MPEPQDAVLSILKNIQQDISADRQDMKALRAKVNDIAENLIDTRTEIADIRREILMHLGLTTRHRVDFESLLEEVSEIKSRLATLEARS